MDVFPSDDWHAAAQQGQSILDDLDSVDLGPVLETWEDDALLLHHGSMEGFDMFSQDLQMPVSDTG